MTPEISARPQTSVAELIAQATEIGCSLRAQQAESDARGYYSDAIHQRLLEAGFYRILQPCKDRFLW
jgi:3-hydroxy-9,10-secoandrosta-1,3,5(10)-triene-9,17-dione monooxygenase